MNTLYNYFHACVFVNSVGLAFFSLESQMEFAGVLCKIH